MTDYDLIRRCDVLEILDNEGSLGRTRKLVEQLVAVTPEAQAAEIKRLRGDLAKALEALGEIATDEHPLGWIAITALADLTGAQKDGH